ncbi:MAG: sugar phosphate nucleotidyltransferase, partial [Candidatus Omnitrophota bacterium]
EDIKKIAEAEIEKLFNEGAGTPGVHSGVGAVLDPAQVDIFDAILEESFKRDRAHKIKRDEGDNEKYYKYEDKKGTVKLREGFLFVKHDGLLEALDAKGLPHNIHPGRGGDVNGHKALMCHVDSFVFESLTLKELVTIGRHELAHLDIFNVEEMTEAERDEIKGTESYETWRTWVKAGKPAGDGQEAFVNSLEECNTSAIAQRIETIIKETRRRKVFEDEALNSVIYSLISKAEEEREKHGDSDIWKWVDMGNNRAFDVFDDDALDRAIIEYNWNADNPVVAPLGMTVHYGTRGTKRAYFESKRDASKLEIHCYVRRSVIEALSDKEKEVLLNNARMHILVSLGEVEVPQGMKEDEYVNLQAGCNITSFWKTIEQARRQGLLRSATRLVDEGIEQGDSKSVALGLATGVEARISMDDKDMLPDILMNIYQKYERETDIERKRILPIYKEAFDKLNARYPLVAKDWLKEALQSGQLSKRASKFINRLLREWLKPKDISGEEVNAVIMAGGGGTRLFPLSTDEEPKQLLSLIGERPLVVITIERLMQSGIPLGNIYIQTVPDLKDKILELVRKFGYDMKKEQIFAEPKGADTAAAIGYASAKLIERGKGDMPAFICTADHIIGDVKRSFRACYLEAAAIVKSSPLVATLGIRPQGPSSEYGHIMVDEELLIKGIYRVGSFKEKPKEDVAAKLWGTSKKILAEGKYTGACLFNSGMFIATPKTFFLAFRELSPRYHEGLERIVKAKGSAKEDVEREVFDEFAMWKAQKTFPDAKRIPEGTSVDYALAEPLGADQTDDVGLIVKPGEFPWTDIGSYKAVFEHYGQHMEEKFDGYGNLALKPRGADNVDVKLDKTSTDCLVIIGDMWPEEEDIKIKLDLRGLKNAMVIYNAKTRATMVAPMNLSGSSIKMIRAKIGEKGPRWAHFLKGSKPADTERKAIYRSTQDHTRLFSADFGRVLQVTLENEMHADIYSDYGLVVLSEVRDARVVQHKSEDGINICVGVGNKKDDFWKLAEELRERKVEQVKSLGAEFSEERVRDFLDEGRIADATIQRYARMYALDPDINSEVVISELVKIFIALAIKEEDIEKREAFIKQQKGEDMLSPYF